MMPWLVDVLAGCFLALGLYVLVRFRMMAAPKMRDRYGGWARWSIWVLVAILMIVIANVVLILLRQFFHEWFGNNSTVLDEIVFAFVALLGGYFLVARYVRRQREAEQPDNDSDCGIGK